MWATARTIHPTVRPIALKYHWFDNYPSLRLEVWVLTVVRDSRVGHRHIVRVFHPAVLIRKFRPLSTELCRRPAIYRVADVLSWNRWERKVTLQAHQTLVTRRRCWYRLTFLLLWWKLPGELDAPLIRSIRVISFSRNKQISVPVTDTHGRRKLDHANGVYWFIFELGLIQETHTHHNQVIGMTSRLEPRFSWLRAQHSTAERENTP